jgi:hypothetical protein
MGFFFFFLTNSMCYYKISKAIRHTSWEIEGHDPLHSKPEGSDLKIAAWVKTSNLTRITFEPLLH